MQIQQNNNWIDMPLGEGARVQSNLLFQPLMSVALSEEWGLYMRPVTIVNSLPHLDRNGRAGRTAGFGDTVLGVAAARPLFGRKFIAYACVQQWFKVGGDGRDTNQMNGVFNFTYTFENGLTIVTQPSLSVNWEAPEDNRVAFGIGPQLPMRGPADVVPVAG